MAYLITPEEFSAAYRPVKFRNRQTLALDVKRCRFRLSINGESVDFYQDPQSQVNDDYLFDLDVQELLQKSLPPFLSKGLSLSMVSDDNLDTGGILYSDDLYVEYIIQATLIYVNNDGLLELAETPDISGTFYAFPFSFRNAETHSMSAWRANPGSIQQFLTDANDITIGRQDHYMLSYLVNDTTVDVIRFRYVESGVTNDIYIETNPNANIKVQTIRCGPVNLDDNGTYLVDSRFAAFNAAWPSSFDNVESYSLQLGRFNNVFAFNFEPVSEVMRFNVSDCPGNRLYWMNLRGGYDAFTFGPYYRDELQTDFIDLEIGYDSNPTQDHLTTDRGIAKVPTDTSLFRTLKHSATEGSVDWIYQVLNSPEVYLIEDGNHIAVRVEKTSQELGGSRIPKPDFEFTIYLENIITQQG